MGTKKRALDCDSGDKNTTKAKRIIWIRCKITFLVKELDCLQTLEPHERDFLTESNIFFDSKHEIFESPDLRKPILKIILGFLLFVVLVCKNSVLKKLKAKVFKMAEAVTHNFVAPEGSSTTSDRKDETNKTNSSQLSSSSAAPTDKTENSIELVNIIFRKGEN